jgi:hypothetical protein
MTGKQVSTKDIFGLNFDRPFYYGRLSIIGMALDLVCDWLKIYYIKYYI